MVSQHRTYHTATLLLDGRVLVTGGESEDGWTDTAELYNPATGTWSTTGSLSEGKYLHAATLLRNGKVLITAGFGIVGGNYSMLKSVDVYDPATGTCTPAAALANARDYHTATLLRDGRVMVAGGYDFLHGNGGALASVEIYDPDSGAWSAAAPLNTARRRHTATVLPDGKVLVACGFSIIGDSPFLASVEIYDPAADSWTFTSPLNKGRYGHLAILLPNGEVLITSGLGGFDSTTTTGAQIYSPATGSWRAAPGDNDLFDHTAVLLPDGRVLVAGGSDAYDFSKSSDAALLFDSSAPTWSTTGTMIAGRDNHTSTLLPDGKVLAAGGSDFLGRALSSAELYDALTGRWTATGAMKVRRVSHSTTLLKDGRVLVVGGVDEQRLTTDYNTGAEIYDPAAGNWTKISPPAVNRVGHTATLLPDGRVLIAGGLNGMESFSARADTEIYDPVTGLWGAGGMMASGRMMHTATLLPNGKVLIAGGSDTDNSGWTLSCLLYDPVTNTWSETGPTARGHRTATATLLPSGEVLIAGGHGLAGGVSELYDPSTGTWRLTGAIGIERFMHTATLLPDGRVLITGDPETGASVGQAAFYNPATEGWTVFDTSGITSPGVTLLPDGRVLLSGGISATARGISQSRMFDPGLGYAAAWRPVISSAVFDDLGRLVVSGTGFRGISGASSGHTADSSTNHPVVKLRRLDNGQTLALPVDPASGWTDTSFTSLPVAGFPQGHVMVTVFVNGIPSVSSIVVVPAPEIGVERAGTGAALTDGGAVTFDSTAPGAASEITFTVKNTGTMDLTGLAVSFSGANAGDFTLTAAPADSVAGPSGSTAFTVRFAPVSPGVKTAVLHLVSSDTDESPFELTLTGAGSDSAPVIAAIANQTVDEDGAAGAIAFTVGDGETPGALTLTGTSSNPSLITASGIVFGGAGANRTLTLTPLPDQSGAAVITVTVSDGVFRSSTSFTLTVIPVDDPPALAAIANPAPVLEDAGLQTIALSGISAGPGEGAQALTLTAVSSNPALVPHPQVTHSSPAATGSLTFTPAANAFGSALITVSVSDGPAAGHTVSQSFTVTVTPVNDPPTLAAIAGPAAIAEDSGVQTVFFTGVSAGPGEDGQPLSVTAVSSHPALIPHPQITYSSPQAQGTLRFTPVPNGHGTAIISVTVSDGQAQNSTAVQSFTVMVTPVNDPPALAAIAAPAPLREGAGVQRVNFSGVSAGAGDTEPVTVTAVSSNPALIAHPSVSYSGGASSSGFLEFSPAPGMSGAAEITVTADDGRGGAEGRVSRSFTVRVLPLLRGEAAGVTEGNEGTASLSFRLFINSPQTEAVRVNWSAQAGTALAGSDFSAASGTAVIAAGRTETFAEIAVTGDTAFEADETLTLGLSNPSGAFLGDVSSFTGTIVNDDAQPALTLTPGSVTEARAGGPFLVWVKASPAAPSTLPLSWTVQTRAGTAQAGDDFTPLGPLTLTFAPGETVKWVAVGIAGSEESAAEGDEEFYLDFTPAAGPPSTQSSACVIRQLAVRDFIPLGRGVYAVRFPTGAGQSYMIEEAQSLEGPWASTSSVLTGSGSTVTQVVFSEKPRVFFRVKAASEAPGAAAAGP